MTTTNNAKHRELINLRRQLRRQDEKLKILGLEHHSPSDVKHWNNTIQRNLDTEAFKAELCWENVK